MEVSSYFDQTGVGHNHLLEFECPSDVRIDGAQQESSIFIFPDRGQLRQSQFQCLIPPNVLPSNPLSYQVSLSAGRRNDVVTYERIIVALDDKIIVID